MALPTTMSSSLASGGARGSIWLLVCCGSMACPSYALAQSRPPEKSAIESAAWTKTLAPPTATARAANVFVYDEAREGCVVFGGRPVDDHGRSLDDTGIWRGDTWIPVAAEYGRRGHVTGAFDSLRRRTVVYGGTDGLWFFGDTWEFDGSAWTRRMVDSPSIRSGNGLAYDSRRSVTVLFGGHDGSSWKDEVWEWNGVAWAQGCTAEPCSMAPRPAARAGALFVYDGARGVSVLFGGRGDEQSHDDTWSWDGERWHEHHPAHVPAARARAAATFDPVSKRVLLFGGLAAGLQDLNDFWAWDGHDWSSISQTTMPFARHGAGMAWHAKDRRGILFGGSASGKETDAWEFQLFGTPCSTSEDCHVGACVKGWCPADPSVASNAGGTTGGGGTGGESSGGNSSAAAGFGGGSGGGGKPTTAGDSPVPGTGPRPAASGGTVADGSGAGASNTAATPARDAAPPALSFYSCALSSSATRGALPFSVLFAAFAIWLSRRRSRVAGGASVGSARRCSRRDVVATWWPPRPKQ
jgi:uncharacterized membrane protein YgcG